MTRWFVQIEARFASVWPEPVEEAVAERLESAGRLFDRDNGVQGDPGPILCGTLVVEAKDADAAAAFGWSVYREALDAAGAEGYAHERTITKPMAEVERRFAELRAHAAERAASISPSDDPQAFAAVWLRDDLRPTAPPPASS